MAPRRLPLALVDGDDAAPEDLGRETAHIEREPDAGGEPARQVHLDDDRQGEEEPDDLDQHRRAAEQLDIGVDRHGQPPAVREQAHSADDADDEPAGDRPGGVGDGDQQAFQPPPFVADEGRCRNPSCVPWLPASVCGGAASAFQNPLGRKGERASPCGRPAAFSCLLRFTPANLNGTFGSELHPVFNGRIDVDPLVFMSEFARHNVLLTSRSAALILRAGRSQ